MAGICPFRRNARVPPIMGDDGCSRLVVIRAGRGKNTVLLLGRFEGFLLQHNNQTARVSTAANGWNMPVPGRLWQQRASAMSAVAWRRHGGDGAQRNGGSAVVDRMDPARHRDVGNSMSAARQCREGEVRRRQTARRQQGGGSSAESAARDGRQQRGQRNTETPPFTRAFSRAIFFTRTHG